MGVHQDHNIPQNLRAQEEILNEVLIYKQR